MTRKLPPDAFAFYHSLGPSRSYDAVARKYGVTKRTVTRAATVERWQERLDRIEKTAQERSDEKAIESIEAMNDRHLKIMKFLQSRAIETLQSMPMNTVPAALKALQLAVDGERVIRGQPSDRTAVSIEDVIRREYDRWMTGRRDGDAGEDGAAEGEGVMAEAPEASRCAPVTESPSGENPIGNEKEEPFDATHEGPEAAGQDRAVP